MREKAYRSDHAKQVMEVAINELDALLKQRTAISRKVKAVKRTVRGLASLFGEEIAATMQREFTDASAHKIKFTGAEMRSSNDFFRNWNGDGCTPKLERACRIALLESENPASAGQIYDRINRRGSYQLARYKHPLMRIIATLDLLVKDGKVRTNIVGDCRCWQWNTLHADVAEGGPIALDVSAIQTDL